MNKSQEGDTTDTLYTITINKNKNDMPSSNRINNVVAF